MNFKNVTLSNESDSEDEFVNIVVPLLEPHADNESDKSVVREILSKSTEFKQKADKRLRGKQGLFAQTIAHKYYKFYKLKRTSCDVFLVIKGINVLCSLLIPYLWNINCYVAGTRNKPAVILVANLIHFVHSIYSIIH